MKLFADENVERATVAWFRDEGHDVLWAAESFDGEPDEKVLARANAERRVFLTSDLDFGEHVFRARLATEGLILIRIKKASEEQRLAILKANWPYLAANVLGHFIILSRSRMRRRRLP